MKLNKGFELRVVLLLFFTFTKFLQLSAQAIQTFFVHLNILEETFDLLVF